MMTKEKIIELVESKAKPLTNDDIVEIGIAHRELPKAERSWSWVANLVDWQGSGESLRCFVLRNLKDRDMIIPKNEVTQNYDLFKQRQLLKDERTTLNAMLRKEARFEVLKEVINESISKLPKLKTFDNNFTTSVKKYSEGILMLSDWHIGQDCDNFYNKYNNKIAEERISKIVDKAISYCQTLGITRLHVLNLGDLIEGKINNTGRIVANERALQQLMYATEMMANVLNKLQFYIPEVTYRSVTDNHGNIDSNYKDRLPEENLNILTTWYLKARLKNTSIIFKDDNLDIGLGRFELDNGMKVAFFHGHEDPKDKTLQNLVGATHEWIDVVCAGHLHNPAEHVYQDMRLFINGSLCGTGQYALSHRMFTKPSQKLIIVEDKNFINIDLSAIE